MVEMKTKKRKNEKDDAEKLLKKQKIKTDDKIKVKEAEDTTMTTTTTTTTTEKKRLTTKPLLEGEEYRKLNEFLVARRKMLKARPNLKLSLTGSAASLSTASEVRVPLLASEIQQLLLYLMMGDKMQDQSVDWCRIDKWNKFGNVVCLVVDGDIGSADLTSGIETKSDDDDDDCGMFAKNIDLLLQHKLDLISPKTYDSFALRDMCTIVPSKRKQTALKSVYKTAGKAIQQKAAFKALGSAFPIKKDKKVKKENKDKKEKKVEDDAAIPDPSLKLFLLLSAYQMVEEGYPVPMPGVAKDYTEYVFTSDEYDVVAEDSPIFSVDCEMCMTTAGKNELTRICVVNNKLEVVYHSLVMPTNHITRYMTRYSGITKEMLEGVTTTLADVQSELRRLLPPNAILVGQSLNSDLLALQMMHPYVIDTSVIFNVTGVRRRKTKLSVLTSTFLGEEIQQGGKKGHNPIEDAQAAMKLVNLKLEKGYEYGDATQNGQVPSRTSSNKDSEDEMPSLCVSAIKEIRDNNRKVSVICQDSLWSQYSDIPGLDDAQKAPTAKESVALACKSAADSATNLTVCNVRLDGGEELGRKQWKKLDKWTRQLWEKVGKNGLLITVWSGAGEGRNGMVGMAFKKEDVHNMYKAEDMKAETDGSTTKQESHIKDSTPIKQEK